MDLLLSVGILLFIAGFILVGIEMVVPGFGFPGISGIICLIAGILLTAKDIEQGLTITVIVVVILAVMLTVVMMVLKRVKSPIVLDEKLQQEQGFLNASDLEYLVGKEGIATTDLKPSGKCRVEGVEFDVRSEGNLLKKGTKVRISRIHEKNIMVSSMEN
ncbi:MAG: serine protease [Lachnospiraceae bacterium]|nr:serine protease [Lachnospiraceae bacterium]